MKTLAIEEEEKWLSHENSENACLKPNGESLYQKKVIG
jgi:hypothetical protein